MWLLLFQTGQTFAEHSSDLYPLLLWLILVLLTVLGGMIVAYIKQNREDMGELKVGQQEIAKIITGHIIENGEVVSKLATRVSIIEDRIGIHQPREFQD